LTRYRREDLVRGEYPESLQRRADEAGAQVARTLTRMARRLSLPVELVVFAVVGIPDAAVRDWVGAKRPIDGWTADAVECATRAVHSASNAATGTPSGT